MPRWGNTISGMRRTTEDVYARNRIRHDAIPALHYANSAAERSIAQTLPPDARAGRMARPARPPPCCRRPVCRAGMTPLPCAAPQGPVLDAALHALVSPVRDAEEKYISLLHFLILKGGGCCSADPGRELSKSRMACSSA